MALAGSGKTLLEQMTRIKSFVNRTNVLHVLFGTYELAHLTRLSGQLARRCEVVHLARYRAAGVSMEDGNAFLKIVGDFQHGLPVAHHLDLRTEFKYLHERTIGCVGILRDWLMNALGHAQRVGRTAITKADLEATARSISELRTILDEVLSGEQLLSERQDDFDRFLQDAGHLSTEQKPQKGMQLDLFGNGIDPHYGKARRKRRPFEQAPYRHPVGGSFALNCVDRLVS